MAHSTQLKDSHLRSLLKGFTWRIIATLTTIVISLMVTGEVGHALTIGGFEFVSKYVIYYLHERAWANIPLGTLRKAIHKAE